MKTNKLVKLGIATFAVAVLGVVPAFTVQADTNVAEQPIQLRQIHMWQNSQIQLQNQ